MKHVTALLAPFIFIATSQLAFAQDDKSFQELVRDYDLVSTSLDTTAPTETVVMIFASGQDVHRCRISAVANYDPNVAYEGRGKWNIYCRPLGEISDLSQP